MSGSGPGRGAEDDLLVVGKIAACYGIKGWVKIRSYTEPQENFLAFGQWLLLRRGALEAIEFDAGRRQGKGLVAHIAGVDERTLAETYTGLDVAVRARDLPQLDAGEYYWRQLQGLQVWCADRQQDGQADTGPVLLGTVDHLLETGANDVLVVVPGPGSVDGRERLIPYVPGEVVTGVDLAAGRIDVDWFLDV
ncbi:MAG: ribosome maturation factor RimM [Halioglobus sp.]|nr:ribosome maturation factor RimM [Halioglobus sp.]